MDFDSGIELKCTLPVVDENGDRLSSADVMVTAPSVVGTDRSTDLTGTDRGLRPGGGVGGGVVVGVGMKWVSLDSNDSSSWKSLSRRCCCGGN